MARKEDYLREPVRHIDPKSFNAVPILEAMASMSYQARNLARAAQIYERMLGDPDCTIILCLAGSLINAGLKLCFVDLLRHNMVDVVVATGANIVDQDFLEALGFKHYIGSPEVDDNELRALRIDRIYDTFLDEDDLRVCDHTVAEIADRLPPGVYSSREFVREMGRYLVERGLGQDSLVRVAYEKAIPIFIPAFSDCSAGFGLVLHQWRNPERHVAIDSVKDFRELTRIKIAAKETGLVMVGGGVPKNFAQDVTVAADVLGFPVPMHKYAIQITTADVRDGGLSGSTLKEASSWGKVAQGFSEMVWAEATLVLPLLVSYVYHKGTWRARAEKRLSEWLDAPAPLPTP
ncbi:deoxyhypusine synthase [Thermus sp.]|uniref:1,9-bis(guanidino)-5-aza-nonane synthase n=1 Tax=Thermus sp. TaxID=275 RepID=UPI00260D565C|nr:deoxyhypusine synthase [Thermus sp.]MCS7216294.1 deoxyhypusine synthase [Candidatus Bipolaricaulota bacterium]MCX7850269.1 deoxyhypusine synthase [Thermus sp.]MDW8151524.1 deoxyhypusine synthase [Candidatus Bipolaricaulota bacterium]